jgi:hypothetical protein
MYAMFVIVCKCDTHQFTSRFTEISQLHHANKLHISKIKSDPDVYQVMKFHVKLINVSSLGIASVMVIPLDPKGQLLA